jgi:hypothetical protein
MKKSGLDELEALNLDWKVGHHLLTLSVLTDCDFIKGEGEVFQIEKRSQYFNMKKRILENLDTNSPFTFQYNYGYLR